MENAILAGQQKRQGLLLHLGGNDIANLLSPETKFHFFFNQEMKPPQNFQVLPLPPPTSELMAW